MAITVLPQKKEWSEYLVEGMNPVLQMAMGQMLKSKFAENERKKNMDLARQTNPELFTETTPVSTFQKFIPSDMKLNLSSDLSPQEQANVANKLTQAKGINIPEKYRSFAFNKEKLGMPNINVSTGEVSYKPEDAFNAYYRSLIPKENIPGKTSDIVYRTTEGVEVDPQEAINDIQSGNTNYFVSKKEMTRTGIKETPISKPEDLEKVKAIKEKSDFIIGQTQDTLNTISEVEKGINNFGLFGQIPSIPGTSRYNWETNVNKLLSGKVIDLMTKMKEASKTGATGFGQLSEKEGQILREASTALKRGLAPQDAQKYLNIMKESLYKIVGNGGQNITQNEQGWTPEKESRYQELLKKRGQ